MENSVPALFRLLALPAAILALAAFVTPLLLMLSLAVLDPEPGFSNFGWIATSGAVHQILFATIRFSLIASVISVSLGFLLAYVIWRDERIGEAILIVVLVSFWLSVLVRCFALILVLGPRGPLNSLLPMLGLGPVRLIRNELGVFIGMVHYLVPFATLTILSALRGIDTSLLSAARSLGAGKAYIFRSVILPLSAPGSTAALGLCLVISFGFYITPALLGGGRVVMLAEFISFHVQNVLAWGKASALAVMLISVIGLSYLGLKGCELLLRRRIAG
jgi:putative spermidine/putrescine transport system permease protein